jgi:hypothetical protein
MWYARCYQCFLEGPLPGGPFCQQCGQPLHIYWNPTQGTLNSTPNTQPQASYSGFVGGNPLMGGTGMTQATPSPNLNRHQLFELTPTWKGGLRSFCRYRRTPKQKKLLRDNNHSLQSLKRLQGRSNLSHSLPGLPQRKQRRKLSQKISSRPRVRG